MNRKLLRFLVFAAMLVMTFAIVIPTGADTPTFDLTGVVEDSPNGIYIVRMADLPVVAYEGDIKGLKATKAKAGEKINPNSPAVVKYVEHLQAKHERMLAKFGGEKVADYYYSFNGFAAYLTMEQAAKLSFQKDVLSVEPDQLFFADTFTTPDFLGLTAEGGAWDMGYDGEDIIIGIVDSGIWPESMSFTDRTGTNGNDKKDGKLDYQQIPGWHGKCTPGEEFTAADCNQKLIGARYYNAGYGGDAGIDANRPWEYNSPRDYNGHGTHTASTAGGNGGTPADVNGLDLGTISGMAPRARIAAYKALWQTPDGRASGFTVDLVAAIDQAVADGVDVINYSISGSQTLMNSSVAISFLFATDAGVFVAASAGNAGPGASTVAHNTPWQTTVAAGTHDRYYSGTVTLGDSSVYNGASFDSRGAGPADLVYGLDVVLEGEDPDEARRCFPGTLDPAQVSGKIVLCDRGTIARVDKSYAVAMAGGIGMIHANTGPSSINADLHSVPTVHVDHIDGAAIRTYVTLNSSPSAELTGGVFDPAEAPLVASFSSRGPALAGSGDLLKPDIMAPGVDVLAAVAPPGNAGRDFDMYSGTSMAAPHIAGLAALVMQAHPDWSPMMVKSALMTTTTTTTNQGNPIPGGNFAYGAGQVVPNSAFDPGLVYDAGFFDWLAFLCNTSTAVGAGTCAFLENLGYSLDPSDLNYPSISIGALPGSQTVTRTVTNVGDAGTYNVSVDAPAGIDVVVTPASLTLAAGESASFDVAFTANASVVAEAWTFGSLTWSDGVHDVTSPIALFPVAIATTDEVHGAGTAGSLDFDVTFGYSGDYTAAPHGLVPADTYTGTVADDPLDNFDAALGTCDWSAFPAYLFDCVGIDWYEITIPAGTAHARFSLFDAYTDGADDLDLYVYSAGWASVGSSGSGTSAEEVNAAFPAPGVYHVAVHGWGTDGPDANYTLFSWAVPVAAGSTNMVLTAPAAATLSATETVTVDWAGLSAGTKYLGAVSHSDSVGLLKLTLVSIDTD